MTPHPSPTEQIKKSAPIDKWENIFDTFRGSTGAAHYQIKDFIRQLRKVDRWFRYETDRHFVKELVSEAVTQERQRVREWADKNYEYSETQHENVVGWRELLAVLDKKDNE